MARKKIKFPFKLVIVVILLSILIYYSFTAAKKVLFDSDFFQIKEIDSNNRLLDLTYLKGQNIFTLDLEKLSRDLFVSFPNYRKIRIARQLPATIKVDFVAREVIGYVKLYRYFAVDEEKVLFYPENNQLDPDLAEIEGLETKIFGPKSGQMVNLDELKIAINLIKNYNNIRELREFKMKRIIASDINNLSFFIEGNIQVKIGAKLRNKLKILRSLLLQSRSELSKIRYIDLRFREPVIKYGR